MPEEMRSPQPNTMPATPTKKLMPVIIVIVVLLVLVAVWFGLKALAGSDKQATQSPTTNTSNDIPAVNNTSDLDKLETDLNSTTFTDMETDLNQNDTDASSF